MENALEQNRRNSVPNTARTSGQISCNQRVGCLLGVTKPNTPVVWTEKERYGSPWLLALTL